MKLTKDQESLEITEERINWYLSTVGEDFMDQNEKIVNHAVMCGYLLAMCDKSKAAAILKNLNGNKFWSDLMEEIGIDEFYKCFCKLCNLTVHLKKRVNEILISMENYYGVNDENK